MASHRIGARVAGLSPAQLCAIIEAQAGASDAALRVAEEHAARLVEQPEWVLSEVLLSPDLAPHGTVPTGRGSRCDSREGTAGTRAAGLVFEKSGMAPPATLSLTHAPRRPYDGRAAVARLPKSMPRRAI